MDDIFELPFDALPPLDDLVRATMDWHFAPQTGSPFWLRRARTLDFDPRRDVKTAVDLRLFPDVSDELRSVPAAELIPNGCRQGAWAFQVFESGGTTGEPKRIIEMSSRRRGVEWVSQVLAQHGFPGEGAGHWLHIGPSGPHAVGRSVGLLAQLRRSLCYYIDFDPRWVKRCIRKGRPDDVSAYIDHIVDQALEVLGSQPVSVIFATPPVLEAICANQRARDLLRSRAKGLIWSGTSISQETLRLIEDHFVEAKIVGIYGNTMMGIACQRPRLHGETERCVFQSFYPYCSLEVVHPGRPEQPVPCGQRGQVKVTLMSREIFLPNNMERDTAVRVAPAGRFTWDGVAQVGPLPSVQGEIVEGVY
jgi:phenylacetate-coenzyme A ligase PaaK-like adenylate-forming protein